MNFIIRKLKEEDVEQVYKLGILKNEFTTDNGSFWTKEQLSNWCKNKDDVTLVAEQNNEIIGFSLYANHIPTKKVTWENIYVKNNYRNIGVGSALIEEGLKNVKDKGGKYIMCCVNSDNQNKFVKYLEKFGFKKYGDVSWVDMSLL